MNTQSRRLLLNLALLLLVAGLGGLAWWKTNQPQPQPATLLSLSRADITHVTITRQPGSPQQDTIKLERQGEHWRMLEPKPLDTNPARISQLFTLLDETVAASYDASGKDLEQYGLEPAALSVAFNADTLLFGAENPVSNKRYFLHNGQLKLASEAVYGLLTGEALELVSNKLIPEGRNLKSITLPIGHVAKADTLQSWQSADALRLENWDGKGENKGNIVLTLDNGSQVTLALLSGEDELVLANAATGIRYILAETQRNQLLPAQ